MSLVRNIVTVGGGTLVSRLLAYLRDAWIAALLGAGLFAEAFFAMLQVVNFFRRLLADGALNGAFVPIYVALRGADDGEANANRFTRRSLIAMLCIGGGVALLVNIFAWPLMAAVAPGFGPERHAVASLLIAIATLYIGFAGMVAVLAAALNAENRVAAVAVSTVAFNLTMVAALAFTMGKNAQPFTLVIWLAGSIVAAGAAQLVITAIAWSVSGKRWQAPRARVPNQTVTFLARAAPGVIAAGIPQLKLIAAAAIVSPVPAAVSWMYYANRLYELPLGVASVAIAAVIVPRLAAALRAGAETVAQEQSRAFELALGLALPAAAGFALLATPIAGGLFEHGAFNAGDTQAVAAILTAICAGLPGHVLEKLFGAVSFANGDARTPMLTALCGLAVAIAGGVILFPIYGFIGAAAAIAVSGWVGATLLGLIVHSRGWLRFDAAAGSRLTRIVAATIAMSAAVGAGLLAVHAAFPQEAHSLDERVMTLAALVALGLTVYGAALHVLGVAKLTQLAAGLRAGS